MQELNEVETNGADIQADLMLHGCLYNADHTTVYNPQSLVQDRMLPPSAIKINSCNYFERSSSFIFHHTPRNTEATGWMESLAVQMLLL
jgi:hypothetical protein